MNIFQRIATFIFRLLGVFSLFCAIGGFFYSILLSYSQSFELNGMSASYGIFSGAFYFVLGLASLLFSQPLGKLLGKGLEDKRDDE